MKVAYITEHSPSDITAFSGIPHFMHGALRQSFETVHWVQALPYSYDLAKADPKRGLEQLRAIGQAASERLRSLDYDFVLCQGASAVPFLETDRPIALWHDSVFSALLQLPFQEFQEKYPLLYEWDRLTLEKLSLAGFAGQWQIDHVATNYGVSPDKCMVLPFGANVEPESAEAVFREIRSRDRFCCRLTFLGIEWARKGLHLAYDVVRGLERKGIDATLDVIGCNLPRLSPAKRLKRSLRLMFQDSPEDRLTITLPHDKRVQQLGFLRKDEAADIGRFKDVLRGSHFLLHPASFECFGIALTEANAFGVPVITVAQYGPDTIVRSGVNGYKYPIGRFVEGAVDEIAAIWQDNDRYIRLAESSYGEYADRLNWLSAAALLRERMAGLLQASAQGRQQSPAPEERHPPFYEDGQDRNGNHDAELSHAGVAQSVLEIDQEVGN